MSIVTCLSGATNAAAGVMRARTSQPGWAALDLSKRLAVLRRFRREIARNCWPLVDSIPPPREPAETISAEILPLLEAARFLERNAPRLLAPKTPVGRRPLWLWGVRAEIRREPVGVVLILAPSNYPIMLPGVQVLQALAAGNAVCLKPAPNCAGPANILARFLAASGLPPGVLVVLDESPEAGEAAVAAGPDRIVLTGSATTGARVLAGAASRLTPATMELSGCDAMFVLPGADLSLVADSIAYGLRLNAGATCIAPRRVFVPRDDANMLKTLVLARIYDIAAVVLPPRVENLLHGLLDEAEAGGATVIGRSRDGTTRPVVVVNPSPDMRVVREDVFAPITSLLPFDEIESALAVAASCPYALGASVFGPRHAALKIAARVRAGSVVINDIIVPTADPRLPFGGRGASGFGVTRGAEGLLEMTVIKTVSDRHGSFRPHLRKPQPADAAKMAALVELLHAEGAPRWPTLRTLMAR